MNMATFFIFALSVAEKIQESMKLNCILKHNCLVSDSNTNVHSVELVSQQQELLDIIKRCVTVNQKALFPFQKIRFGLNQLLADDLTIIANDDVVSKIFFSKVAPRQMFDIHNMFRNYKQLPDRPNICSKNGKDLSNKNVFG